MIDNLYSTGLPVLDVPPLIHRDLGAHLGSASIAAADYIAGCDNCTALSTLSASANNHTLYIVPFVSPWFSCSVDQIQFEVTTAQASTEAFIGLFENSDISSPIQAGDLLSPGRTLYKSGSVSTASSGLKASTISPAALLRPNRIYWLALAITAAATPATVRSLQSGGGSALGMQATSGTAVAACFRFSSTTQSVAWGDNPSIQSVAGTFDAAPPLLRYRLIA